MIEAMAEDLLEKHRGVLLARARFLTGNDADAEDLAQETLLRAHRKLHELEDGKAALAWLFRIAERLHLDRVRRRDPLKASSCDAETLEIPDTRPSGLQVIQVEEMGACTRSYLDKLRPSQRRILELHDVEGRTAQEIAALLGITAGAAKVRLHRARASLRRLLDEACHFSHDDRGVFVCEPKK